VTHHGEEIDPQLAAAEILQEGAMTRVTMEDVDHQNEEEGTLVTDEEGTLVTGAAEEAALIPTQTETIAKAHVVILVGEAGETRTI